MAPRQKTVFAIPKMDCAAEERLIRMALAGQDAVKVIHADLAARRLTVVHDGPAASRAYQPALSIWMT